MPKWVYQFNSSNCEGTVSQKPLLGGKGANLAEMGKLGLPVPPGFTITTEVCTEFYKNNQKYPVAFVVLSQLNRNIDAPDRQRDGEYGNYVLDSDIYGSDALLQHADVVMGINKPSLRKIRQYGPERFIINDEDLLVFHFLKSRNGTTRISFFKLDRSTMRIVEIDTPAQATKKMSI